MTDNLKIILMLFSETITFVKLIYKKNGNEDYQ